MTDINRRQFLRSTAAATTGLGVVGSAGLASAHGYSVISTRGHYNGDGDLNDGYSKFDYETTGVPGPDGGCADDLTIHVHGYDNGEDAAFSNFDEAYHNLMGDNYWGEVAGFSWDSDAPSKYSWNDWGGFGTGQEIAQKNGYALAQFALDYKWYYCPGATLRFTCHSLGAQVVLNCLRVLHGSPDWTDNGYQIETVHLLGAAQDNEAPTLEWTDTYYPIRDQTHATFNYHSDDDSTLENLYWPREFDRALGETGYEDGNTPAPNYTENDVTSQVGSNHSAYMDNVSDEIVYHMQYADYFA